jgi:uncharacterized paraquat-inducible protein A
MTELQIIELFEKIDFLSSQLDILVAHLSFFVTVFCPGVLVFSVIYFFLKQFMEKYY